MPGQHGAVKLPQFSCHPAAGLARWSRVVLCAGVSLVSAVGSAAGAYCAYAANRESTVIPVIAGYSNESLLGPWIFEALELPGYQYIVFDGQGGIVDLGAFCFQSGTYQVQPNGTLSATVVSPQNEFCEPGPATVYGTLTSPTTGTLTLKEGSAQMRKVEDPSACQGNWEGVLTEVDTQQDYPTTLSVGSDGTVTSFAGFPSPVTGKLFADSGSIAGFLRASTAAPYFDIKILGTLSGTSATGTYAAEAHGHSEDVRGEFVLNRPVPCAGDCGGDEHVTVDELLTMVNIALGNADVSGCEAGDLNQDGQITVDEILTAVNNALNAC